MVLAIWLYCTGKWDGQGRESVKQTNKARTFNGCTAPRMIWLFFPWVYAFDHVADKSVGQTGLIPFIQLFFYPYRTEPRLAVRFHETFSSLLVRLVMHPFWRSGDRKQTHRRLISGVVQTAAWIMFNA